MAFRSNSIRTGSDRWGGKTSRRPPRTARSPVSVTRSARIAEAPLDESYARADRLPETGDLAVRGGLLDVFPPHRSEPVRIEFDLNAIASIRSFDPDTQRSTGALSLVSLPPMALTPDTRQAREAALRVLADCRTADDDPPVPRDVSLARRHDGLEELLPLLET